MARAALLLLGPAAATALGVAALALFGPRPGPAPRPPAPAVAAPPAFVAPRAETLDMAAFLARPPFSAARRPAPAAPTPIALAQAGPPLLFDRYQIAGAVMAGTRRIAVLRDMREGGLVRVAEGERLGAGVLVSVGMGELTFSVGDATVTAPIGQATQ